MRRVAVVPAAVLTTFLFAASPGRAGPVPSSAHWTYSTEFSTVHWFPGDPEPRDTHGTLYVNSISIVGGNIFMGRVQPTQVDTPSGGSSEVRLSKITGENPNLGDSVSFDRDFTLMLHLTDHHSGAIGTLRFPGNVSSTLQPADSTSDSVFRLSFTGPTTQSLALGEFHYDVTVQPLPAVFVPPQFGEYDLAEIRARVEVRPLGVVTAPEPSTLVLGGIGMGLLGLASRRSRPVAG